MVKKRIRAALFGAVIIVITVIAPACQAQYTTDWLANTFGTLATHVGNAARSMWVAPEGVIYTASLWDENEGGVAIYQNGKSIGSIGINSEFQGRLSRAMPRRSSLRCSTTDRSAAARWGDTTARPRHAIFSSP